MALSIKTAEADRLARTLARLTGETMTDAVTVALRERLDRVRDRHQAAESLPERLEALARRFRAEFDPQPVTKAEWDEAAGDEL